MLLGGIMKKREFFDKYNGFYERKYKNGDCIFLFYREGAYVIQAYKPVGDDYYQKYESVCKIVTLAMDGFEYAWEKFQHARKILRKA